MLGRLFSKLLWAPHQGSADSIFGVVDDHDNSGVAAGFAESNPDLQFGEIWDRTFSANSSHFVPTVECFFAPFVVTCVSLSILVFFSYVVSFLSYIYSPAPPICYLFTVLVLTCSVQCSYYICWFMCSLSSDCFLSLKILIGFPSLLAAFG
jgi:hypothetical protein